MVANLAEQRPAGEPSPAFFELPVNNSREAIVANVRANIVRGLPQVTQREWTDRPLMIIGGGPSLNDNIATIRAFKADCDILAVNGAYKHLRALGIECEHFMLIDSRRENLVHVEEPAAGTVHFLASQVHPDVFDALADYPVSIFNLGTEATVDAHRGIAKEMNFLAGPIGMASVYAVYLGAALGYRTQMLFGYDFSQRPNERYAFDQPMNPANGELVITINGEAFQTTLAMARTADQFVQAIAPVMRQCALDVRLFSSGLLAAMLHAAQNPATEDSERSKYERIWQVESYRHVSPGLEDLDRALELLKPPAAASIADLGCGTGRVVRALLNRGLNAIGVDIAGNSLEDDSLPFVQATLWDAEKLPHVDYALCTDVLEHIPTERVRDTLRAIAGAVGVACYLNVDTIPDSFGVLIGERLHMTVMPHDAWLAVLREFWPNVEPIGSDPRQAIFVCRK